MADLEAQAYTCEPSSLLASTPCLACYSQHELLAALVATIAFAAGKTVDEVMSDAACFNCLNEKQKLQALITKVGGDLLGENYTPQDVVDAMHCLACVSDAQLTAALVQQLCANVTLTLTV